MVGTAAALAFHRSLAKKLAVTAEQILLDLSERARLMQSVLPGGAMAVAKCQQWKGMWLGL